MTDDVRPDDSSTELVDVIREVRRRWRMKLALRGALGVLGLGLIVLLLSAYGLESWRFTAVVDHHVPDHPRPGTRGPGRLPAGPAADAAVRPTSRSRSTSRSTSRRCRRRSSVRSRPSRGAGRARLSASLVRRLVQSAVEKCREIEGGRGVERRAGAALRRARWRRLRVAAIALFVLGPAYLRHALSALLDRLARCRGRRAVPHRSDARQRDRAEGRRSDDHRTPVRLRRRPGVVDGQEEPDAATSACRCSKATTASTKGCCSISPGRSSTCRSERRTVRTYTLKVVELPVRSASRARVSLPGLHRPAAAEGRRGRRHRGAQGHGSASARGADHGGEERRDRVSDKVGSRCRLPPREDRPRR